jgi:hypothetical protein
VLRRFLLLALALIAPALAGSERILGPGASSGAAIASQPLTGLDARRQVGIGSTGVVGLQSAIFSDGDSLASFTGGSYGGYFASRLDGRFVIYSRSGESFPGMSAAVVRSQLALRSLTERMSVIIVIAGRNGVLTDTSGTRAALQGILSDETALGNTRVLFSEVPLKPSEQVAGAGNANYDLVVAHNAWLTTTFGAGSVIPAQDISYTYPSGDDTHVTNAGYDVWDMRASDVLAAKGWLSTSLPSTRFGRSFVHDTVGKYVWITVPDAANDRLPKTPASSESSWFVWFKASSSGSQGVFGPARYSSTTSTARIGMRYSAGSLFGFFGGGAFTSFATAAPVDLAWHLAGITVRDVAGTKKGDLWFDGTVRGTQQTALALTTTYDVRLGETSEGSSFPAAGKEYQPLVWDVGLTSGEVSTLYNGGVPLAPSLSPQAAHIVSCLDVENISAYSVSRGIPDRAGKNDGRTTGMTSADISTDIP